MRVLSNLQRRLEIGCLFFTALYFGTLNAQESRVVTNTNDAGPGSLREAIVELNEAGGGLITFSNVTGLIEPATPFPFFTNLTLQGPGAKLLRIHIGYSSNIGNDSPLNIPSNSVCVFKGLNFSSSIYSDEGGIMKNHGTLRLEDCLLSNTGETSTGMKGIGIFSSGNLIANRCTFYRLRNEIGYEVVQTPGYYCFGTGSGGAIYASGGKVALTNCTVSNSGFYSPRYHCGGNGAAIYAAFGADGFAVNCSFVDNFPLRSDVSGNVEMMNCLIVNQGYEGVRIVGSNLYAYSRAMAGLERLDDQTGPTPFYPLVFGSPAMEQGDLSAAPLIDQRFVARPQVQHVDLGAVEFVWPENTYNVEVTTNGGGLILGPLPATLYPANFMLTLEALPLEDHAFSHWSGDVSGTNRLVTLLMDSNKSVTAHFVSAPATVISPPGSTQAVVNAAPWGPGSLRQAIRNLNASGGGTIDLSQMSGKIFLPTNLPPVTANAIIQGPMFQPLGIRWTNSSSDFLVFEAGTTNVIQDISIDGVNDAYDSVVNRGDLTVNRVAFHGSVLNQGTMSWWQSRSWGGRITGETGSMLQIAKSILSGKGAPDNPGNRRGKFAKIIHRGNFLSLDQCKVSDFNNGSSGWWQGGAVFIENSNVEINNCTFESNTVTGAASYAYLYENRPAQPGLGGCLYASNSIVSIIKSTFQNNQSQGGRGGTVGGPVNARFPAPGAVSYGGAIYLQNSTLFMSQCSFANNSSTAGSTPDWALLGGFGESSTSSYGGAVGIKHGNLTAQNCTFSGNAVTAAQGYIGDAPTKGGSAWGGAIYLDGGYHQILACTIVSNIALAGTGRIGSLFGEQTTSGSGLGGGLYMGSGTLLVTNSLLAHNRGYLPHTNAMGSVLSTNPIPILHDFGGSNLVSSYSLWSSPLPEETDRKGNILSDNPLLGPLQDNGGPVWTHALLSASPAIDAGHSLGLPADSRGQPRTKDFLAIDNAIGGDGTDIGAVEVDPDLRLLGALQTNGEILLLFTSTSDASYGLAYKRSLIENTWSIIATNIPGTGGIVVYPLTDRPGSSGFYRIFKNTFQIPRDP